MAVGWSLEVPFNPPQISLQLLKRVKDEPTNILVRGFNTIKCGKMSTSMEVKDPKVPPPAATVQRTMYKHTYMHKNSINYHILLSAQAYISSPSFSIKKCVALMFCPPPVKGTVSPV
jgi:hypothetical protein